MTQDPALRKPAQMAIDFLVKSQHSVGGYRYKPLMPGDTSVTGWCLQALQSGYLAGLSVPRETLYKIGNYLDTVQTQNGAAYGYVSPGGSASMTAVGLLCREYLGWGPRNPGLITGVNNLKATPPASADTIYYTYYATQVMHHMGGEAWAFWNPKVRDYLISKQDRGAKKPHEAGSWDSSKDQWGNAGGRIMTTSLSLLTLEVYYRHLPLYRRDQVTPQ